ncbi:MAG TPA: sigma-70 family RNA polymerase sigma factor [Tepidisphaeraceae bacterium]
MPMTLTEPDLVLLTRFRDSRDAEAFREIVRRYAAAVYATCHRILHDPGRAEDAAQETFYRLMTRPQKVSSSLGGWLHRAATRLALDIQRSDTSRKRREASYETTQSVEASTWADVVPQLDEALATLPEELRDLLVRHFLRGESQSDLANELSTSPATLSRRMKNAIEALRQELGRRGVCIAPLLLLKLMGENGHATVSPALKLALGKMSLFCTARGVIVRPVSWLRRLVSLPRSVWGIRWALGAAMMSVAVCVIAIVVLQHVDWRAGRVGAPGSVATPHQVEPASVAMKESAKDHDRR